MSEHRVPTPADRPPDDEVFLDWVSGAVEDVAVPLPLEVELRLNEMNRAASQPRESRGAATLVVTLVVVLVAGALSLNLGDPATLLGVFLLAGAFAASLFPASSDRGSVPRQEI